MTVCSVRNIKKEYKDFTLKNVSFDLIKGTVTGFVGRNGAGKSTTLKAMLNLISTSGGFVEYFGKPLADNENEIKQKIGYSCGTAAYYPKKKLKDIKAVTKTFYDGFDEAAYQKYLKLFGLDEDKTPEEMSCGMKVKANLLLCLSHGAEILILDEPTSGLDPFSRDELTDLFITLKGEGVTVLFSTHIISDLQKCADRIIHIKDGKIMCECEINEFKDRFGKQNETLEDTLLRLEKEGKNE